MGGRRLYSRLHILVGMGRRPPHLRGRWLQPACECRRLVESRYRRPVGERRADSQQRRLAHGLQTGRPLLLEAAMSTSTLPSYTPMETARILVTPGVQGHGPFPRRVQPTIPRPPPMFTTSPVIQLKPRAWASPTLTMMQMGIRSRAPLSGGIEMDSVSHK